MPKCEFCNKVLKTEKGFQNHMCEKKKRFVEFNEVAYHVWLMICNIFRIRIPKDDNKKKISFINDVSYNKIVEFTNWVLETQVLNLFEYLKFLKDNEIKIIQWTNSRVYHSWLYNFLNNEPEAIAIKRSKDYLDSINLTLDSISSNRLFLAIKYGKISNKYLKFCNYDVRNKLDQSQWIEVRPLIITDVVARMEETLSNRNF